MFHRNPADLSGHPIRPDTELRHATRRIDRFTGVDPTGPGGRAPAPSGRELERRRAPDEGLLAHLPQLGSVILLEDDSSGDEPTRFQAPGHPVTRSVSTADTLPLRPSPAGLVQQLLNELEHLPYGDALNVVVTLDRGLDRLGLRMSDQQHAANLRAAAQHPTTERRPVSPTSHLPPRKRFMARSETPRSTPLPWMEPPLITDSRIRFESSGSPAPVTQPAGATGTTSPTAFDSFLWDRGPAAPLEPAVVRRPLARQVIDALNRPTGNVVATLQLEKGLPAEKAGGFREALLSLGAYTDYRPGFLIRTKKQVVVDEVVRFIQYQESRAELAQGSGPGSRRLPGQADAGLTPTGQATADISPAQALQALQALQAMTAPTQPSVYDLPASPDAGAGTVPLPGSEAPQGTARGASKGRRGRPRGPGRNAGPTRSAR